MASILGHVAINADDPEASLRFYEAVFGWTFSEDYPGFFRCALTLRGARQSRIRRTALTDQP